MNTPLVPAQAAQNDTDDRIAIVGLGACLPDAPDVATFWRNVLAGHVAIGEVPPGRWDQAVYFDGDRSLMDRTYSRIGGFIRYEPADTRRFRLVPRSLPAIDDVQKFALVAVAEALGHAGLKVFAFSYFANSSVRSGDMFMSDRKMVDTHIAPPFDASLRRRPSSRLRGWSFAERRLEWESRIGDVDSSRS